MKVILISGASTGIGRACALSSAQKGDIVYAGCRKNQDIENLNSLHENIKAIKFDITLEDDIKFVFDLINKEHHKLDCLFNNAGVSATGTAEFQDIETYRSQLEINFLSHVSVTQKFIPLLRKSNDPRIIFTSSAAGLFAKPMMAAYSASKFALEAFIDSLRVELKPWNIKISGIEPGKIKTEIYKKTFSIIKEQNDNRNKNEVELYKDLLDIAYYNVEHADSMSSSVDDVVQVYNHALYSKKPKTRYPIGGDAKLQAFVAKFFSDSMRDKMILNKLKKLKKKLNANEMK